jgi:hypothetical protein
MFPLLEHREERDAEGTGETSPNPNQVQRRAQSCVPPARSAVNRAHPVQVLAPGRIAWRAWRSSLGSQPELTIPMS